MDTASSTGLTVGIAVQGRFFAFDLVRELVRLGIGVKLVTNYPASIAGRWGVPPACVTSLISHGLLSRLVQKLRLARRLEPALHGWFGRRAARALSGTKLDALLVFSGVAEECLRAGHEPWGRRVLIRASAHIQAQADILETEEKRAGRRIDRPSPWMIRRELREYALAERIWVLSTFALHSFQDRGLPPERLWMIPLATDIQLFQASEAGITQRERRVLSGAKLQVLNTGTFSYQKGCLDLVAAAAVLAGTCDFSFVGTISKEAWQLAERSRHLISFRDRVPEHQLPEVYAEADVFLMPTLQDGFAAVLAQAKAAGLPLLTTPNSTGPDLVREGVDGWLVPIRRPDQLVERLRWCDANRAELAAAGREAWRTAASRDWKHVATDLLGRLKTR